MTDVDSALRGAIRELTEDVHVRADLASTAMASGRRLRSRRRLRTSLAAAVAVAAVAVGTPILVGRPPDPAAGPPPAPPRTTLPEAPEVPGAAELPELVGADPGSLHFDVDGAAVPGLKSTRWESTTEGEWLFLSVDQTRISVHLPAPGRANRAARTPVETTFLAIGGRPATLDRVEIASPGAEARGLWFWQLRWKPVDRLEVMVAATDHSGDLVVTVARALRLDRAQQCPQPVRAAAAPVGTRLERCSIALDASGAWLPDSSFSIVAPMPLGSVQVTVGEPPAGRPANRRVDGWAASWSDESDMLIVYDYIGQSSLTVMGESEETVTAFVRGLWLPGDPRDVRSWSRPL